MEALGGLLWSYSIAVSTSDFESENPSSSLGRTISVFVRAVKETVSSSVGESLTGSNPVARTLSEFGRVGEGGGLKIL